MTQDFTLMDKPQFRAWIIAQAEAHGHIFLFLGSTPLKKRLAITKRMEQDGIPLAGPNQDHPARMASPLGGRIHPKRSAD
jgi:hypothetical protein